MNLSIALAIIGSVSSLSSAVRAEREEHPTIAVPAAGIQDLDRSVTVKPRVARRHVTIKPDWRCSTPSTGVG
jgi:hypothetical protein